MILRAKTSIEKINNSERESIIVTELPFQVNKAKLIEIAHALLNANRAAFDRDLESIGESLIPHRLSLSADPAREARKWLERR